MVLIKQCGMKFVSCSSSTLLFLGIQDILCQYKYFVRTCFYALTAAGAFCVVYYRNAVYKLQALLWAFFYADSTFYASYGTVLFDCRLVVAPV